MIHWLEKLKSFSKHTFYNIVRVMRFIPIVWKFRNWDYGYIFMFNYELHKMLYEGIYERGHHLPNPKTKRALKTIIELYRRLWNENYTDMVDEQLTKDYGPANIYFDKVQEGTPFRLGTFYRMRSRREDRLSPDQLKKFHKKQAELYNHARYLQKKDIELLGKLIAKHHRNLWD